MIQGLLPDGYIGPFSNWAERHSFIIGLTLGFAPRDRHRNGVIVVAAYLLGANTKIRREIVNQPHYFIVGLVGGRLASGG